MTDTPILTEPDAESVQSTMLERIALPLVSFGGVLFLTLLTSQIFLLPRITTFVVGGASVTVDEAILYERTLRAEVLSLEQERTALVLPHIDAAYDALMESKHATPSVTDIRREVERTMQRVAALAGAEARVDALLVDAIAKTVIVRGTVDDPKPGSIAVVAAALEAVRALPIVTSLESEPLTREAVPGVGYRSPFKFTFTLP